jgi:rare lipoprotein A (peptidoglycan hydrolase)
MKKIFLIILILVASCSQNKSYKKYNRQTQKFQRVASKFTHKTKPSETLQTGAKKNISSYNSSEKTTAKKNPEIKNDAIQDNAEFREDDLSTAEYKSSSDYKGYFKIGNPYQIFGVSYVPQNYEDYEEIGTASWYGDDFHGKLTANGETYNMEEMTAAHPTLPLPSLVRVTNLKNDKSVVVRVNDRGPFAKNRIIDVSEKAADSLGFKGQGTTQVKIELLRNETDEMLEKLKLKN